MIYRCHQCGGPSPTPIICRHCTAEPLEGSGGLKRLMIGIGIVVAIIAGIVAAFWSMR